MDKKALIIGIVAGFVLSAYVVPVIKARTSKS